MKKSATIFTVTVIRYSLVDKLDPQQKTRHHCRTWGWYSTFARAANAVLKNVGDLFEDGYYKHAVIEEMTEGIMPIPQKTAWYSASYPRNKIRVVEISCPKRFKRAICFSMG